MWFLIVLIFGCTGPLVVFLPLALLYAFSYMGIELFVVSFLIDGYFGYGQGFFPWYTLGTIGALVIARFLRPYISVYNR